MIAIRPATPSDTAQIFAFIRDLAEYEKLSAFVTASEKDIAGALFREHPHVFCDVAEWNGAPAGFALWFYNFSTFRGCHGIYLEDLFVKPELRGKGIGKALLANLAKRVVTDGCARLEWAVLDWNRPSIDFYESLGARRMGDWLIYRLDGDALERLGAS